MAVAWGSEMVRVDGLLFMPGGILLVKQNVESMSRLQRRRERSPIMEQRRLAIMSRRDAKSNIPDGLLFAKRGAKLLEG